MVPRRVAALAGLVLFAAASTFTIADPDLWGHLRVGLDLLETPWPPSSDPYSFTQDRPWINHEWLSQMQIALAYRIGGVAGLAISKGALVMATMAIVWSQLRGLALSVKMSAIGVVIVGTGSVLGTLRPQLWSLLAIAILCALMASRRPSAKRWLPPLFAIWANVHGGWIVGLAMLAIWAPLVTIFRRESVMGWGIVSVASAIATLCTPYGVTLWRFLWETVGFTRDLADWQPILNGPVMNWLPVAVVAGAAIWILSRRETPDRWPIACVLALLAFSSWRVSRIAPLFVVSAASLLGPLIGGSRESRSARGRANERSEMSAKGAGVGPRATPIDWPVAIGVAAIALVAAGLILSTTLRHIAVPESWAPPRDASRLLAGAGPGRLVTFFDWGEYAIWHFGPRLRVSMDGRRETVYSEARLDEHNAIVAGDPQGLATLEDWRAEYVWLPGRSHVAKSWLATHGYRIEHDRPDSFVAVRDDLPMLPSPPPAPPGRRSFPE